MVACSMGGAMAETTQPTKLCNTCGKPMPAAGLKCTECDTFQDWRRYLVFSTTALALLTALVSVVATSIPLITTALTTDNSRMSISFGGVVDEKIVVLVTNSGNRTGALISARLTYDRDAMPQDFSFTLPPDKGFVEGGKSEKLQLQPNRSDYLGLPPNWFDIDVGKCDLTILVQAFTGETTPTHEHLDCRAFMSIVQHFNPTAVKPYA